MTVLQASIDKLQTTLPSQVATLTAKLSAVNQTITRLNLERFVKQVNELTTNIDAASVQTSLVQAALDHTQDQVLALTPRVTFIQDEFNPLHSYNASVFKELGIFKASAISMFALFGVLACADRRHCVQTT